MYLRSYVQRTKKGRMKDEESRIKNQESRLLDYRLLDFIQDGEVAAMRLDRLARRTRGVTTWRLARGNAGGVTNCIGIHSRAPMVTWVNAPITIP